MRKAGAIASTVAPIAERGHAEQVQCHSAC